MISKYTFNTYTKVLIILLSLVCPQIMRASVKSYHKDDDGVTFTLDKGFMKIKVCKADIIEVKYTILEKLPVFNSLVENNSFKTPVKFNITASAGHIDINTGQLIVRIDRKTNAITYLTAAGKVITSEDKDNKEMQQQTVAGIETYSC